jgi:hypothetical protein
MDRVERWKQESVAVLAEARVARAEPANRARAEALVARIQELRLERSILHYARPEEEDRPARAGPARRRPRRRRCSIEGEPCGGSGWVLIEEAGNPGWEIAHPCECRAGRSARLPRRFTAKNLAPGPAAPPLSRMNAEPLAAAEALINRWRAPEEIGPGLWLTGRPGSARKTLAAYIARELLAGGRSVLYYPATELVGRLKRLARSDRSGGGGHLLHQLSDRLATVELLVITDLDEIGPGPEISPSGDQEGTQLLDHQQHSESTIRLLWMLADERFRAGRPLLVTSELCGEPFTRRLVGAVGSQSDQQPPTASLRLARGLVMRLEGLTGAPREARLSV